MTTPEYWACFKLDVGLDKKLVEEYTVYFTGMMLLVEADYVIKKAQDVWMLAIDPDVLAVTGSRLIHIVLHRWPLETIPIWKGKSNDNVHPMQTKKA